ncbi:hypothetical protein [Micromonospora carbonacea]|uniref:hypothetical protein n=1 Tax=Micromonospora carbonacea TaxID=47853 RepID=UPI0018257D38|nr:hypothetical protein [Micromonospora carbonacea]MBB5825788.1 hypothetical protein [Micromonospora carbonacea]
MVWAVTSANHENTRRNPVPYHRREAAIERFSVLAGLRSVVVPVFDTAETDRFAEVTLKNVAATAGLELTLADTVVACSTPQVAPMYARPGFPIAGVEADVDPPPARGTCCCGWPPTTRPGGSWPTRRPSTSTPATGSTTWSVRWCQPLHPNTPAALVHSLGVPTTAGRAAAIRQHVLDMPAPIVATALGYHHATTARLATEAGTTWSSYAPGNPGQ